ncbi:membrane hypothetical protein [Nostocoides japonicum T1-X7]|uniref:O-antigen ligase-related domain-containing protein n=1 Tax=Nostocoides japonicum T1-X7 TaxID=1194083 RepID=A0A077LW51_9MICO|nr:O-antigen ligase family protein [Tetrasphaera japonica]CCH78158.1 membrane hypothetical protein [Tetrasphaera japonica T1-X7]
MTQITVRTFGERSQRVELVLTLSAAVLLAVAAALSGLATLGSSRALVYAPILAAVVALIAVLALTRFAAFVYLLLGARTLLDTFKLSGPAAGNTATNSAAARGLDISTLVGVAFILAAVLWLAAQHRRDGRLVASPVRTAWLMFLGACLLSVLGSEVPLVSLMGILRVLAVAMMFIVLEQLVRTRADVRRLLLAVFVSLVVLLAYTVFAELLGHNESNLRSLYTRLAGPFSQSTTFARYLAFVIVFGIAVMPHLAKRWRWMVGAAVALSGVFMLLTLTRGALVATVLGLLGVAILQRRWKVIASLVVAGLLALILVPGLGSRLDAVTQQRAVGAAPNGNSLEWRFQYWSQALPLANRNPVNGIGVDMTQYKTPEAKQPHNDYIKAYVETGLLGLATYLLLLGQLITLGVRAVRRTLAGTFERGVAVGYLACATMFAVQSLAANVISSVVVLWYLAAFAAAASAVMRYSDGDVTLAEPHLPARAAPSR